MGQGRLSACKPKVYAQAVTVQGIESVFHAKLFSTIASLFYNHACTFKIWKEGSIS